MIRVIQSEWVEKCLNGIRVRNYFNFSFKLIHQISRFFSLNRLE